jgi:transglutaminase-like putative cysteine protease
MRLRIRHETHYTYSEPALRAIETLKLTPRGHDGQFVIDWRLDVDHDCRLAQATDAFGNTMHSFTVEGPIDSLLIVAEGRVETTETNGVVSGQIERFPPAVFMRETALTTADAAIRQFADGVAAAANGSQLATLHALNAALHTRMAFEIDATRSGTQAAEAFDKSGGVCQDFAHVMIAAARHLGIPARYVSGYLFRPDDGGKQAGHAWAEVLVDGLGWVGFDAANDVCPTESYVRVAIGLDANDAAPVRGARYGGAGEALTVRVTVEDLGGRR